MMKHMKKKTIAMVLAALAAMTSLTACSGGQTASSGTDGGEDGTYTIGVVQYATHPSLDNCYEGFLKGLADEGFVEGENLTIRPASGFRNTKKAAPAGGAVRKNLCGYAGGFS